MPSPLVIQAVHRRNLFSRDTIHCFNLTYVLQYGIRSGSVRSRRSGTQLKVDAPRGPWAHGHMKVDAPMRHMKVDAPMRPGAHGHMHAGQALVPLQEIDWVDISV